MSAQSAFASSELDRERATGSWPPAAAYAQAAVRFAAEQHRLQRSGGRPAQVRALGAMADLFTTLAEARRARDEAERRLAEEPAETLEEILTGHRAGNGTALRSGAGERP